MMTTFPEGIGLVLTPLKDLVQGNRELGMDNSIIRSGQDPEVLSFHICGKTNVFLPQLWLTFAREKCRNRKPKLLESTKQGLHLITGICRAAYGYKMYNNLFFFLDKDVWHSHPFSKGIIDN